MAHQAVKPYSFLMYVLSIIAFFFLGLVYAAITEAGKGQMLAGGAIVFFHGLVGAFIGLCASLFIAFKSQRHVIIKANIVLTLIIVASFAYFYLNHQKRQREKIQNKSPKREQPTSPKPTAPVPAVKAKNSKTMVMLLKPALEKQSQPIMGLGMFSPNIYTDKTLYFYSNLTPEKSVQEHIPIDSITFKQSEYDGFDIATAPPWLIPDHLKLDYDILYFKVKSVSHDFLEVIVNTTTNRTALIDRYAGNLQYWPEFLLGVHSVEFLEPSKHKVYIKPYDYASHVNTPYNFMRPLKIENEWMYVELQDYSFKAVGKGWIRWTKVGKLLITYSLLN